MQRRSLSVRRRIVPAGMIACLVLGACAASPIAKSAKAAPPTAATALPPQARIIKTADITMPPVVSSSSLLPGADQRDVVFVNAHTGFLATGGEEIGTNQGGVYNPISGGIQRTIDAGKSWQTVWTEPGADISSVTFASPSIGFAAGRVFPTASDTSAQGAPVWLRTTDGGTSWIAGTPQLPATAGDVWWALHFVASAEGIVLAAPNPNDGAFGSMLLRSADAGAHWAQVGPTGWAPSGGIGFASPSTVFATGFLTDSTTSARLWVSRDAGRNWSAVQGTVLPFGLLAVEFVDPLHGFAAGGNLAKYEMHPSRALIVTSDGGRTWSMRYQSPDSDISNPISQLHFIDANRGWASIGSCSEGQNGPCGGPALVTIDGGRSWRTTSRNAVAISAVGPSEAWALDSQANALPWHSIDAGASWTPVVRPGALGIYSLAGAHRWLIATTAAGSWQSTDSGSSWSPLASPVLGPLTQGNSGLGFVAQPPELLALTTDTGLRISHDGGATAFDVTLPGQDPNEPWQVSAAFSDTTHGFAVVGAQNCTKPPGYTGSDSAKPPVGVPSGVSTIAVTNDGGNNWTPMGTLDIQPGGVAASTGLWAIAGSGGCGTPHNLLMISRDQGRHWKRQGLPSGCVMAGAASPGTIWLSCLDSLLETQDGAATWTQYRLHGGLPSLLVTGSSEAWAYGPAGALWHTTTGGRTWTTVPLGF